MAVIIALVGTGIFEKIIDRKIGKTVDSMLEEAWIEKEEIHTRTQLNR